MKLLKLALEGIDLFEDKRFEIDLFASDRVVDREPVHELQKGLYTQNAIAIAGINATGKTTALRIIQFAARVLGGTGFIDFNAIAEIAHTDLTLKMIIWCDSELFCLVSEFEFLTADSDEWQSFSSRTKSAVFHEELLYRLDRPLINRKMISSFDQFCAASTLISKRSDLLAEGLSRYLPADRSIITAYMDTRKLFWFLFGDISNPGSVNSAIIQVFDPRVDYIRDLDSRQDLSDERKLLFRFKDEAENKTVTPDELLDLLSAGTIRGTGIIMRCIEAFRSGGYFILDEIENHLNKQLVGVLISLFNSTETNPLGATLIFTTHYPEVLDFLTRKDNVYFLVRNNMFKTNIIRYSNEIKRVENKKSEVFLSNYVKGTAPKYDEIKALQKAVKSVVMQDVDDV
ncbi:MAG: ATP-binding protein [Coriobacteriia bacterium]|nr:ATP-binding protein [Coriobacteriia bacterium]